MERFEGEISCLSENVGVLISYQKKYVFSYLFHHGVKLGMYLAVSQHSESIRRKVTLEVSTSLCWLLSYITEGAHRARCLCNVRPLYLPNGVVR